MKQGRSYIDVLTQAKNDKFAARDFVGTSKRFGVDIDETSPVNMGMTIRTAEEAGLSANMPVPKSMSRHALQQTCSKFKIPFMYAERLAMTHPDLLAFQVNALMNREPKKVMVRTLDDKVRAVLSNRFRIIDNWDVVANVMPIIEQLLGVTWQNCVRSCEVTDNRMYLKIVHPNLVAELPPPPGAVMGRGHTFFVEKVQAAIVLKNSEIGLGSLQIAPSVLTDRCTNLATFNRDKFVKYHVGKEHKVGSGISAVISDETRSLEDAAALSRIRDVARGALDGTVFNKIVQRLQAARTDKIEASPVDAVEELAQAKGLNKDEADEVLKNLIEGADLSKYGMHAAVTRTAQDVSDYDRASELEQLGGDIIELPASDWRVISQKKKKAA